MIIYMTGATGFIGSQVAKHLTREGHKLVCLVRKTSHIQDLEKLKAQLVWGDIRDRRSLAAGMFGCDALIHLAGISSFREQDKKLSWDTNVNGTRNIMESALQARIPRVIHTSTLYMYGRPARNPFDEESIVGPERFSVFARTRYEADRIAWGLYRKKGLPLTVCCPALALGQARTASTIPIVKDLLTGTVFSRSSIRSVHTYVHVDDIALAMSRILSMEGMIGRRFFLAGERISTRRFLATIRSITGNKRQVVALPDTLAMAAARSIIALSDILKPEMSPGYLKTFQNGLMAEGYLASRVLGITYKPIREALVKEIETSRMAWGIYEKRRSRRYSTSIDVTYKAQGEKYERTAILGDISENGMFISTLDHCPRGRYMSASLSDRETGTSVIVRGRIVRSVKEGIAVDFTHKDSSIHDILLPKQPLNRDEVTEIVIPHSYMEAKELPLNSNL